MVEPLRAEGEPSSRRVTGQTMEDLILDAAARVFSRVGFVGASISLIAREASVSRPTVYAYCDSKDAVFERLAERVQRQFLDLQEVSPELSLLDVVRSTDHAYLRAHADNHGLLLVIRQQEGSETLGNLWHELHHPVNRRHARFIAHHARTGELSPVVSPGAIAEAVTGIVIRYGELAAEGHADFDELRDALVRVHLGMLGLA
jgi:AcrR family transcriptional regulator